MYHGGINLDSSRGALLIPYKLFAGRFVNAYWDFGHTDLESRGMDPEKSVPHLDFHDKEINAFHRLSGLSLFEQDGAFFCWIRYCSQGQAGRG